MPRLVERMRSVIRDLTALADDLAQLDGCLGEPGAIIPLPDPLPPKPQPQPDPPSPVTPPPRGSPGVVPREILPVLRRWALEYGVLPEVLLAIEIHETGWYDALPEYPSLAWRENGNPGGMKSAPAQFSGVLETERDGMYLRFRTWQEGIQGHALFIGKGPRYAAIHGADAAGQVRAISDAGYAESPDWEARVLAIIPKAREILAMPTTAPAWRPSPNYSQDDVERTSHGPNVLPEILRPNAEWMAREVLEPIQAALGGTLKVGSWFRSRGVNAAVGGEQDSQHLLALAVDLGGGRTEALWSAIVKSGVLKRSDVRVLVEADHYHLAQMRPGEEKDHAGGQWLSGVAPLPFEVVPS